MFFAFEWLVAAAGGGLKRGVDITVISIPASAFVALLRVACLLGIQLWTSPSMAADFPVKAAQVDRAAIECHWARDRLITVISGPCDGFSPPARLAVGETFEANGKIKKIGVIFVTQVEKDMDIMPRLKFRKGDWYCVAGETLADLPSYSRKEPHLGVWLYARNCMPVGN